MIPALPDYRAVVAAACLAASGAASAQAVIECRSADYRYVECAAPDLRVPQLVLQLPGRACIVNRSWGFDRRRGVLWVAEDCAGRFAEAGAYHHGASGSFDSGARRYTRRGEDAGAMVGGATLGALLASEEAPGAEPQTSPQSGAMGAAQRSPAAVPPAAAPAGVSGEPDAQDTSPIDAGFTGAERPPENGTGTPSAPAGGGHGSAQ